MNKSTHIPPVPEDDVSGNQFEDMLRRHRRGIAAHKVNQKLHEAILASRDTGAKSEVTLKVTLMPGSDDQMTVTIQVTAKMPEEKLPGGIFWVGEDGMLLTSDPKQKELPLREVIPVGMSAQPEAARAVSQ